MTDKQQSDPAEDQKAKFREALERKNKTSHHTSGGGATNAGPARGEHAAEANKREFRRKSGG
jgi:hypothetical protein